MNRNFFTAMLAIVVSVPLLCPAQNTPPAPGPAMQLYLQLAGVDFNPQQVYRVREAAIDRSSVHLTFNEGSIVFSKDVEGRITGAFFEGDGNLLISPPTNVERGSLALFTGSAILSDEFSSAYLRFDGDVPAELKDGLRPFSDESEKQDFYNHAEPIARSLAETDAMRLLFSFLNPPSQNANKFLHLRIGGTAHGTYDVYYDPASPEAVLVAQAAVVKEGTFLDVWTSFTPPGPRQPEPPPRRRGASTRPHTADETIPATEEESIEPDEADIPRVRIRDYKIRAHVAPPRQLEAEALLNIEGGGEPMRLLFFELSHFLKVAEVVELKDGREQPLEVLQNPALRGSQRERRRNDVVAVVLPQAINPGERLQLRFKYAGEVLSDAGGGLLYVGARGTWFPNRGLSFAKFDIEFRYPSGWTLLATGQPAGESTENGEQVSHWVSPEPLQIAGFNLGQYARSAASAGSVPVAAYASRSVERGLVRPLEHDVPTFIDNNGRPTPVRPPALPPIANDPVPMAHAAGVARDAARTIDWLSARIGPYPYPSLWLTQVPGHSGQGWPGLIFLSTLAFLSPEERAREHVSDWNNLLFGKLMVPHETAHQWWGDAVGTRGYRDQWLTEGLANYCALLLLEQNSPSDFHTAMERYRQALLEKGLEGQPRFHAGPVTLGPRLSSSKFPEGYDAVVYGRGTWLLHMLRNLLRDAPAAPGRKPGSGDDLFFAALRRIQQQRHGGVMSNQDVQRAFESVLPASLNYDGARSLEWFFDSWVNGSAIPRFELGDVKFSQRAEKTVVTGKLLQKDAPEDFVSSVPIYAAAPAGGKPILLGRVFTEGAETTFRFTVPAGTKKLLIDPFETLLRQR